MRIGTVCVLLLVALLPPQAVATEAEHAPRAVVAFEFTDAHAFVTWIPGDEPAEMFRIYGITDDTLSFLGEVSAEGNASETLNAVVPGGFATYAVSGVKGGIESHLVYAMTSGEGTDCIIIDPPSIIINCTELDRIDIGFYVELKVLGLA